MKNCPCGTQKSYENCCGMYITGEKPAPTPETLMRSRYTAYTYADIDYIQRTMKGPAAVHFSADEARVWALQVHWTGLEVMNASESGDKGWVEFKAFYRFHHESHVIHEKSEFLRENGEWFYVDGEDRA